MHKNIEMKQEQIKTDFKKNVFQEHIEECRRIPSFVVDDDTVMDIINIGSGAFNPLSGFMTYQDYRNVVNDMHLKAGEPWTIPITLDVPESELRKYSKAEKVALKDSRGNFVAILFVKDIFKINADKDIQHVFGVDDINHPGVRQEKSRSNYRMGGRLEVFTINKSLDDGLLSHPPEYVRKLISETGYKTVAGFQTRNPIHRAHEYLQRTALEIVDALFIHPLIGWKKGDDFSPIAVMGAYRKMIDEFYPRERVILGSLRTPMRYAGPREAIFHALIRKNYGCTHFIVGRDHAGVGGYYEKYAAHQLCSQFDNLGIEILEMCGPFYCKKCLQVVTEKTCSHNSSNRFDISGSIVRELINKGQSPPDYLMRREISGVLLKLDAEGKAFCRDFMPTSKKIVNK